MEKVEKSKTESGTVPAPVALKRPVQEAGASAHGKRYGEAAKRLVVEQIESGQLTVAQAQRQHGIAGAQSIRGWQAKYVKAIQGAHALLAGQIHHSDRGVQYCSGDYVNGSKRAGIEISMAEAGNPTPPPGDMRIPWTNTWRYPYSESSTDFRTREMERAEPCTLT